MKDAFDRPLTYLRLSVTDLCDLRCVYCMPPEGVCKGAHGDVCSLEELAALAEAFVALGVTKIRLTGGEPLVRRGIVSLVEQLNGLRSAGLRELVMTTNGQRLAELAAPLRAAGLDRLNVSLDTLRPDRYRALTRGGSLDRVLAGLEAAEAAGFRDLRLNAVLLQGVNDDELRDLALLARDHPWSVRFIELMPIGPGADLPCLPAKAVLDAVPELVAASGGKAESGTPGTAIPKTSPACRTQQSGGLLWISLLLRRLCCRNWHPQAGGPASRPVEGFPPNQVSRIYTAPGWAGSVGLIAPMSDCFCAACNRLRLTADGRLKLCLHAPEEYPLRGLQGEALGAAILAAVRHKPARHRLSETHPSDSPRPMHQIGG